MDTRYDFGDAEAQNMVYVRQISTATLPKELRDQLTGIDSMYAVHDADGERLALVRERALAFMLARQNELTPVSVH